jgi:hypothetical protein
MRESLRCGLPAGGLCNNLSSELWNKRTGFPSAYTGRVRLTSDSRHSASFTHLVVPRPPRLLPQRRIVQTPSPGACRAAFVDMVISKVDNSNLERRNISTATCCPIKGRGPQGGEENAHRTAAGAPPAAAYGPVLGPVAQIRLAGQQLPRGIVGIV